MQINNNQPNNIYKIYMILGLTLHLKKKFDFIYSDGSNNDIKMENY